MFEDLKVRIEMLLEQMVEQPHDVHELQEQLREKLNEIKSLGMPLPEDLVELEGKLEAELNIPKE
jgi:predicted  nucleic acid-binding Zn-ribbon protein